MPRTFESVGNESMYSLLQRTGYFGVHDAISEAEIRDVLVRFPQFIHDWIDYSENKRTSGGWYIAKNDNHRYEVACVGENGERTKRVEYADVLTAVASFIKREIEEIRAQEQSGQIEKGKEKG